MSKGTISTDSVKRKKKRTTRAQRAMATLSASMTAVVRNIKSQAYGIGIGHKKEPPILLVPVKSPKRKIKEDAVCPGSVDYGSLIETDKVVPISKTANFPHKVVSAVERL